MNLPLFNVKQERIFVVGLQSCEGGAELVRTKCFYYSETAGTCNDTIPNGHITLQYTA